MVVTWNETFERFTHIVDTLGKPIDTGIFETVVALNMHGVRTTASCEGHLDWGVPYPWIDIEPELEQKYQLYQLLSRFYEKKPIEFDHVLIFHGYRLRPAGAAISSFLSSEQQGQKLVAYQAEMAAFTLFLKLCL